MAGNKVLLDTNIISALFKGDVGVANHIDKSEVYLSSMLLESSVMVQNIRLKLNKILPILKSLFQLTTF